MNIACPTCHSPVRVQIAWIESGEYMKSDIAIDCTNRECDAAWDEDGNEQLASALTARARSVRRRIHR